MPVINFSEDFEFPPVHFANQEGLLLIGGPLSADKIYDAYTKGIFPWYSEKEPVLWWSPDPRFVLFLQDLHISQSMRKVLRKNDFHFTINTAFSEVIHACKTMRRNGQSGTWITEEMEACYKQLHLAGKAHSGEIWLNGCLVGGIYGVQVSNVFCAESMFSKVPNASKAALIRMVQYLQQNGTTIIDCQVYTDHVATLGARMISRSEYMKYLP